MGHSCKKPTTAFVSAWHLYEALHNVRGPQSGKTPGPPVPGRFQSAAWAEWAPDLVTAINKAWEDHIRQSLETSQQYVSDRQEALFRMTEGRWTEHIQADHIPYRSDCAVCIGAASRDRPHCLQSNRHLFQLSADVAGPFKPGADFGGSHRYFMAYSIRILICKEADWMAPVPEEESGAVGQGTQAIPFQSASSAAALQSASVPQQCLCSRPPVPQQCLCSQPPVPQQCLCSRPRVQQCLCSRPPVPQQCLCSQPPVPQQCLCSRPRVLQCLCSRPLVPQQCLCLCSRSPVLCLCSRSSCGP